MTPSRESAALLAELERARTFGEDPAASEVWMHAPPELRRMYAVGLVSEDDFWLRLRVWLEFDLPPDDDEPCEVEADAGEPPVPHPRRYRLLDLAARATRRPEARRGD